jgi:hypothetical protein
MTVEADGTSVRLHRRVERARVLREVNTVDAMNYNKATRERQELIVQS